MRSRVSSHSSLMEHSGRVTKTHKAIYDPDCKVAGMTQLTVCRLGLQHGLHGLSRQCLQQLQQVVPPGSDERPEIVFVTINVHVLLHRASAGVLWFLPAPSSQPTRQPVRQQRQQQQQPGWHAAGWLSR